MFFIILFLIFVDICFVACLCFLFYKLKMQDDDIDTLYDQYSQYIQKTFERKRGDFNG